MHSAFRLRACPSSPSMHTLLAFVKGKTGEGDSLSINKMCKGVDLGVLIPSPLPDDTDDR